LDRSECDEEFGAAAVEATLAVSRVELGEDISRRALHQPARQHEEDPVVLRKLEGLELGAVARPELRSLLQEVRNVCTQLARESLEPINRIGLRSQRVCQAQRGRRVGAAAT